MLYGLEPLTKNHFFPFFSCSLKLTPFSLKFNLSTSCLFFWGGAAPLWPHFSYKRQYSRLANLTDIFCPNLYCFKPREVENGFRAFFIFSQYICLCLPFFQSYKQNLFSFSLSFTILLSLSLPVSAVFDTLITFSSFLVLCVRLRNRFYIGFALLTCIRREKV